MPATAFQRIYVHGCCMIDDSNVWVGI